MKKTLNLNEDWVVELLNELFNEYFTTTAAALHDFCVGAEAVNAWPAIKEILYISACILGGNVFLSLPNVRVAKSRILKQGKTGEALLNARRLTNMVNLELNKQYTSVSTLLYGKAKKLGYTSILPYMLSSLEIGLDIIAQNLEDSLPKEKEA